MKNETVSAGEVRLGLDRIQDIAVLGIESNHDTGQACSLIEQEVIRLMADLGIDGPLGRDEQDADAEPKANGNGADAEPEDPEDDGDGCMPEPTPRTFSTVAGLTVARSGTRWFIPEKAPRQPDELRFTRRLDDGGYSWWTVTPADVDYWHTHVSQGRALAFEFLDFVNNPERDENWDAGVLRYIVKDMAKALQADYRQDGIVGGFFEVIGEYLTDGTAAR